ncbi:acyl-CoA dehydrogenase family protein [Paraburkholderia sediminicola]|uniref:acyl-CoA dehydrogenase family protein n=1 Tax=Paraburkholderia sediminicola TaxID=458836 RepID=UPI000E73C95D
MNSTSALNSLTPTAIPPEDEALRSDLRSFLRQATSAMSPEKRARSWSGFDANFSRRLGELGYLGLTFPKEYGGHGRSAFARYVVIEELLNFGAPVAAHWMADRQSGPLLLKYGTEAQKRKFLPGICRGETFFCIGMSEPNAGSDLASVRTRAVKDGNEWRLTGQKIWTTHGHRSHYMIALVRTSGTSTDRQKGLSQVIVDLSLPGITVRPITDLTGDAHFCEVFFDDVRLSADALIGEEGNGWDQVVTELSYERSGPERFYTSMVLFDEWLAYVRTEGGHTPQAVRLAGKIFSQLAPIRALSLAITQKLERHENSAVESALVKDLGTSVEQMIPLAIADDLYSCGPNQSPPAALLAALNYTTLASPSYSLRGGTRDILRGMIARGLGLR